MSVIEAFSNDYDVTQETKSIQDLIKNPDTVLYPEMNVKLAMKMFDRAQAEILAVVDGPTSQRIVGMLSESYARRRYSEELDQVSTHRY